MKFLVVEHDLDERAPREPIVEVLARNAAARLGTVLRLEDLCEDSSRRVGTSTIGSAVAGRSAATPCLRCTTKRGSAGVRVPIARPGNAG